MAITRAEFPLAQVRNISDLYTQFFHDNRVAALEESLANANIHRRIGSFYSTDFRSTVSFASAWGELNDLMGRQPGPYSQFYKFCKHADFSGGRNHLIDRAFSPIWSSRPFCSEVIASSAWFGDFESSINCCPIYFINDVPNVNVGFGKPFEKWNGIQVFVYPRDHNPPHIHAVDLSTQEERRFDWPNLVPLSQDAHIRTPTERAVKEYANQISGTDCEKSSAGALAVILCANR